MKQTFSQFQKSEMKFNSQLIITYVQLHDVRIIQRSRKILRGSFDINHKHKYKLLLLKSKNRCK